MRLIAGLLTAAVLLSLPACRRQEAQNKIPITTSSEKARAAYLKARDLVEQLRAADARPLVDEAIREDPNFAMALLLRARTATSTTEYNERIKAAVAASGRASEAEQMVIRAAEAQSKGNRQERGEILSKLAAAWPSDERAREALGMYLYGERRFDLAAAEFRKATELNPAFAPAYNMLGYALREAGNLKDAEGALRKYAELIPTEPNPLDSLAELMLETGRLEESVALYQKALTLEPKFIGAYRGMATGLIYLDRHKEAMEQLQKMHDIARDDFERGQALWAMAACFAEDGRTREALETIARMDKLDAASGDAQARAGNAGVRGLILMHAGKPDMAKVEFIRAIGYIRQSALPEKRKERSERAHHGALALVAAAKGDFATAHKELEAAPESADDTPLMKFARREIRGEVALREKKYDAAISEFKLADPKSAYVMYQIGKAYAGKKDKEQAMSAYKKAATMYRLMDLKDLLVRRAAKRALGT